MWQKNSYHSSLLILFPFQNNASKTLLAIMESRHDTENAERILYNMTPQQLVRLCQGYLKIIPKSWPSSHLQRAQVKKM